MLAASLCRILALEWAIYCLHGIALWQYRGWSPWQIVPLLLGIALAWRAYLILFTFGYAWLHQSERPESLRIGLLRTLWLLLSEYAALLALYTVLQPARRWFIGECTPAPAATGHRNLPVLLIHGYYCNAGFWWSMRRYLRRHGIEPVFTIDLEPVLADIEQYATQIATSVERIRHLTGAEQVILVGYSMGGLAARAYVHWYGGKPYVARIVTLATPHHGSASMRLSPSKGPNVTQMLPGSPWLSSLNDAEQEPQPVPITSIYSSHDNLIAPQDSALLRYAHVSNIALPGIGHVAVAFSRPIRQRVRQQIQDASRGRLGIPEPEAVAPAPVVFQNHGC